MGANGKVVLPPEAESEAWTQAEINLFRSSNGFVRPKRGEEVKKPAKALVESELKLSAPGVFHSADGGKTWTKCATPKKLMAATVDDVKAAVRACGANLPGKAEL